MKTTTVEYSELSKSEFKTPSRYYYINALGQAVFLHCKARGDAEAYLREEFGSGFYSVRTIGLEKPSGDVSCRGTETRSRKR